MTLRHQHPMVGSAALGSAGSWTRISREPADRGPGGRPALETAPQCLVLTHAGGQPPLAACRLGPGLRVTFSGWVDLPGDSNVSLASFERHLDGHGVAALAGVPGDFVLAYVTPTGDHLTLYRSLTCLRPLYYRVRGEEVSWATNPNTLVDRPQHRTTCDPVLTAAIAADMDVPAHLSWFPGIFRLPAGSRLTVRSDHWDVKVLDDFVLDDPVRDSLEASAAALRRAVRQSINQTATSGKAGVWLSGGLDSAVVALEAQNAGMDVLPLYAAWGQPAYASEDESARAVARHLGLELEVIDGSSALAPGGPYLQCAEVSATPLSHGSYPFYGRTGEVLQEAGATLLLTGFGADQLFVPPYGNPFRLCGLRSLDPTYLGTPLWHQRIGPPNGNRRPLPGRIRDAVREAIGRQPLAFSGLPAQPTGPTTWMNPELIQAATAIQTAGMKLHFESFLRMGGNADPGHAPYDTFLSYLGAKSAINSLTVESYSAGLYNRRQLRVSAPFLHRQVVEHCLRLPVPHRHRMFRGHPVSKVALRWAYKDDLPLITISRLEKVNYGLVDEVYLMNNTSVVREALGRHSVLAGMGIVDPAELERVLALPSWQLRRQAKHLVTAAGLEMWLRKTQEKAASETVPLASFGASP